MFSRLFPFHCIDVSFITLLTLPYYVYLDNKNNDEIILGTLSALSNLESLL